MRTVVPLLVVLLAGGSQLPGIQQAPASQDAKAKAAQAEAKRRAEAAEKIKSYASRITGYADGERKVMGLIRVGMVVCPLDREAAREIFLQAHQALLREEQAERPANRDKEGWRRQLRLRRQNLLRWAGACDQRLTAQMALPTPEAREDQQAADLQRQFRAVRALINDDPRKASDAAVALADQIAPQLSPLSKAPDALFRVKDLSTSLATLLVDIARQDRAAADRAFMDMVGRARAVQDAPVAHLLWLGLYLFASDQRSAAEPRLSGWSASRIGGVDMPHLNFRRAGATGEAVQAYLQALLELLARPVGDIETRTAYHYAAVQLRDRVSESVPGILPELDATIHGLGEGLAPEAMRLAGQPAASGSTIPTAEEEIARLGDEQSRDLGYARLATDAAYGGDFARARALAEKTSSDDVRGQILNAISVFEAVREVREKRLDRAAELVADLPAGFARAALRISIAHMVEQSGDRERATEAAMQALLNIPSAPAENAPYLSIATANVLARLDPRSATEVLRQAVAALNQQEAELRSHDSTRSKERYSRPLSTPFVGVHTRRGAAERALDLPGYTPGFAAAARALASFDFQAMEELTMAVQNEEIQRDALVNLAIILASGQRPVTAK